MTHLGPPEHKVEVTHPGRKRYGDKCPTNMTFSLPWEFEIEITLSYKQYQYSLSLDSLFSLQCHIIPLASVYWNCCFRGQWRPAHRWDQHPSLCLIPGGLFTDVALLGVSRQPHFPKTFLFPLLLLHVLRNLFSFLLLEQIFFLTLQCLNPVLFSSISCSILLPHSSFSPQ